MRLKTPPFWYRQKSSPAPVLEHALSLLSPFYHLGHNINQKRITPQKASIPVICVGNIVAGGTGKTPVAIALMQLIAGNKIADKAHFLTRGYGGNVTDSLLIDYFKNRACEVGDESMLLAKVAFTIVSHDRRAGAALAKENEADLIIMDDGFQNPSLHKDISIVVIDGYSGFGNHKLIPAGPLREPLNEGVSRASAFVIVGKDKRNAEAILPKDKPVFHAHIQVPESKKPDTTKDYIAFAGLGKPEKFYHLLKNLGCNIAQWRPYPDHYAYTLQDMEELNALAKDKNTILITTEKDFQNLPPERPTDMDIQTLPIDLIWNNEQEIIDFLKQKLTLEK